MMSQRSASGVGDATGETRRPADAILGRFRAGDWSRMVRGGPQIASRELSLAGAGPIGAILASRGRFELAR